MKRTLTTLVGAFALAAASATGVFAQSTFEKIEAAAKAEGQLVIYTSTSDLQMQKHITAFEKQYPEIHVQSIRLPSSQLFSRFLGEKAAGAIQADFLAAGSTALFQQNPDDFVALSPDNVPNIALAETKAKNDRYAIFQSDYHFATYNTDLVTQDDLKNHLATWEGLADPRWKAKIALVTPASATTQVSFLIMLHNAYGDDWFKKFSANEYQIVDTASAAAQQVAAGSFELLVPTIAEQSGAIRSAGGPVGLYLPAPPIDIANRGMGVPLNVKHPNAALLYLNWKLGHDGQVLTCLGEAVPVYPLPDPECANSKLPPESDYFTDIDIIDKAVSDKMFSLVGLQQ